jgi:hypothetical protein
LFARRQLTRDLIEEGRAFLTFARDTFKPVLGYEYNQRWDVVGIVGSLWIPRMESLVLPMLQMFHQWLASHPENEFPLLDITAARALELFTALRNARTAVNEQESITSGLLRERNEKATKLKRRIRGTINELAQLIDPLDPRWIAFGLNKPGAEKTPEKVEAVTVQIVSPNAANVEWKTPARARYFHVYRRVEGVDVDFVRIGSPTDPDFMMEDVSPGAVMEICLAAVNSGGEGRWSEVVRVAMTGAAGS